MDKTTFLRLLTEEVKTYRAVLETEDSEWIVKGFIDVGRNIYTMTNDTKVVSKILELILIPRLEAFAGRYGLVLELPSAQNFYPDLTFKDEDGPLFAVAFKSRGQEEYRLSLQGLSVPPRDRHALLAEPQPSR